MKKRFRKLHPALAIVLILIAVAFYFLFPKDNVSHATDLQNIPEFSGTAYVTLNQNQPGFTQEDMTTKSYESYAPLDSLGRCGVAMACIGQDLMPTEDRGSIGQVKPTGWQTVKYDFVDGKYLYNRCHLIGFQLTGENANKMNLITGTRYLNVEGMLPFENMVADYIRETGNHVLYRITPVYQEDELVARGVVMEAYSVEDNGEGICFHIYAYNNQPGVVIDYTTGQSTLSEGSADDTASDQTKRNYILNTNSNKFHDTACSLTEDIKEENREEYYGSRQALLDRGFSPCGSCKP